MVCLLLFFKSTTLLWWTTRMNLSMLRPSHSRVVRLERDWRAFFRTCSPHWSDISVELRDMMLTYRHCLLWVCIRSSKLWYWHFWVRWAHACVVINLDFLLSSAKPILKDYWINKVSLGLLTVRSIVAFLSLENWGTILTGDLSRYSLSVTYVELFKYGIPLENEDSQESKKN